MTPKEAIILSRKYNLEKEIRQELAKGLTPEQALEEWDILLSRGLLAKKVEIPWEPSIILLNRLYSFFLSFVIVQHRGFLKYFF